jgi:hypothetical protein
MTAAQLMRVLLAVVGLLLLVGGVGVGTLGGGAIVGGIWMIASGTVLLLVAAVEVMRYRSEAAEANRATPGPGGGETGRPEARFKPTDEVFVDPTSQRRMRVYTDGRTGERRYVAEG